MFWKITSFQHNYNRTLNKLFGMIAINDKLISEEWNDSDGEIDIIFKTQKSCLCQYDAIFPGFISAYMHKNISAHFSLPFIEKIFGVHT